MDWLGWLLQQPPNPLLWIGLFATAIALGVSVMALSIWNRPKISLLFEIQELDHSPTLLCRISNQPVTNQFLNIMGVYRREAEISAIYSIENVDKAEIIVGDVICDIYTAYDQPKINVMLRCISPAQIKIVEAYRTFAPHQPKNIDLSSGKYRAFVTVITPEKPIESSCEFIVNTESHTIKFAG
jgi:hypothetical protein